jgi:hypothetical protein
VTLLPLFQGSCWFRFLSPKRRKGLWVFKNRSQQAGEGRTNIPDSDGFEVYLQGPQVDKRNRSDTAYSDKHDGKRHKLGYI